MRKKDDKRENKEKEENAKRQRLEQNVFNEMKLTELVAKAMEILITDLKMLQD